MHQQSVVIVTLQEEHRAYMKQTINDKKILWSQIDISLNMITETTKNKL